MSNKQFECPRCYKRCGNAGALKTHMKTHPECECFSDDYSDEEDSDYEESVIPKKKQAKRKLRANEAASSKRIKPNPKTAAKPQLRVPKKLVPRAIQGNQAPKKRPRASIEPPGPHPDAPPSKRLRPKPSVIPSRR